MQMRVMSSSVMCRDDCVCCCCGLTFRCPTGGVFAILSDNSSVIVPISIREHHISDGRINCLAEGAKAMATAPRYLARDDTLDMGFVLEVQM